MYLSIYLSLFIYVYTYYTYTIYIYIYIRGHGIRRTSQDRERSRSRLFPCFICVFAWLRYASSRCRCIISCFIYIVIVVFVCSLYVLCLDRVSVPRPSANICKGWRRQFLMRRQCRHAMPSELRDKGACAFPDFEKRSHYERLRKEVLPPANKGACVFPDSERRSLCERLLKEVLLPSGFRSQ